MQLRKKYESEIKQLKELRDTQKATIDKNIARRGSEKNMNHNSNAKNKTF